VIAGPVLPKAILQRWLEAAGFKKIEISVVAREESPPHFPDHSGGRGKINSNSEVETWTRKARGLQAASMSTTPAMYERTIPFGR